MQAGFDFLSAAVGAGAPPTEPVTTTPNQELKAAQARVTELQQQARLSPQCWSCRFDGLYLAVNVWLQAVASSTDLVAVITTS